MSEQSIDPEAASCFDKILKATETSDHALFSSVMNEKMKTALPQQRFEGVCQRLSPFFSVPYRSQFMGDLRNGSSVVYFWKLTSDAKPDDMLARMSIKEGLVSGLLFTPPFDTGLKPKSDA